MQILYFIVEIFETLFSKSICIFLIAFYVANCSIIGSSEECLREIYIHDHVDGEHTGR